MTAHQIKRRYEDGGVDRVLTRLLSEPIDTGERDAGENRGDGDRKGAYGLLCTASERMQTADDERKQGERIKR